MFRDRRLRLAGIYAVLAAVTAVGMHYSGKYVHRKPEPELIMALWGTIVGLMLLLLTICLFTYCRLRLPRKLEHNVREPERDRLLWERYTRFPLELFFVYAGCGMLLSQLYHFLALGLPPWPAEEALGYGQSSFSNLTTFIALGVLHYGAARWVLRPSILGLRVHAQEASKFRSAGTNLIAILVCGLVYMLVRTVLYVLNGREEDWHLRVEVLLSVGGTVFVVTFLAVVAMSRYWFRDLEWMADRLRELAGMTRGKLLGLIPIASPYESGELTAAFNALQKRIRNQYTKLERDLDLACRTQQQQLSGYERQWREWTMRGSRTETDEVGGGFYDAVPAGDGRLALVAGTVIGDALPSALAMSALRMLVRANVQAAESAERLLAGLVPALSDIAEDQLLIHLGVAFAEPERGVAEYASAGEMTVIVERDSGKEKREFRSAPIGAGQPRRFDVERFPIGSGRCRILLTGADGAAMSACRERGDGRDE